MPPQGGICAVCESGQQGRTTVYTSVRAAPRVPGSITIPGPFQGKDRRRDREPLRLSDGLAPGRSGSTPGVGRDGWDGGVPGDALGRLGGGRVMRWTVERAARKLEGWPQARRLAHRGLRVGCRRLERRHGLPLPRATSVGIMVSGDDERVRVGRPIRRPARQRAGRQGRIGRPAGYVSGELTGAAGSAPATNLHGARSRRHRGTSQRTRCGRRAHAPSRRPPGRTAPTRPRPERSPGSPTEGCCSPDCLLERAPACRRLGALICEKVSPSTSPRLARAPGGR